MISNEGDNIGLVVHDEYALNGSTWFSHGFKLFGPATPRQLCACHEHVTMTLHFSTLVNRSPNPHLVAPLLSLELGIPHMRAMLFTRPDYLSQAQTFCHPSGAQSA
jgi:hypothetical protein